MEWVPGGAGDTDMGRLNPRHGGRRRRIARRRGHPPRTLLVLGVLVLFAILGGGTGFLLSGDRQTDATQRAVGAPRAQTSIPATVGSTATLRPNPGAAPRPGPLFTVEPPAVTVLDDFQNPQAWTGGVADAAGQASGKKVLRLSAGPANGGTDQTKRSMTLDGSDSYFRLWLNVSKEGLENFAGLTVQFGPENGNNMYSTTISNPRWLQPGWNRISLPRSIFVAPSNPVGWSQIKLALLRVRAKPGASVDMSFGGLEAVRVAGTGMVTITHDDANYSDYSTVMPLLDSYGYRAVVFVATQKQVGQPGKLSVTQLRALQDKGWDVSSHGQQHVDLTPLDSAAALAEIRDSQKWLQDQGFANGARFFSPTAGIQGQRELENIKKVYSASLVTRDSLETVPPGDPYQIHRMGVQTKTTLAEMKSWIDMARNNKEWLILNFHLVTSGAADAELNWPAAYYEQMLSYIKQSGLPVVTLSDVFDGMGQVWR